MTKLYEVVVGNNYNNTKNRYVVANDVNEISRALYPGPSERIIGIKEIGDVIISQPVFEQLHKNYKETEERAEDACQR